MQFKELVKSLKLDFQLPFDIDFEVEPSNDLSNTVEVAGFKIPKYNELLVGELWFFEAIANKITNNLADIQSKYIMLSNDLMRKFEIKSFIDARMLLLGQVNEDSPDREELEALINTREFEDYLLNRREEILDLSHQLKSGSDSNLDWLKVTFFLLSRYDSEWTIGKTIRLKTSQIKEILDFIALEANGGRPIETSDDIVDEEDPKKS